jgi:hypothetical protein
MQSETLFLIIKSLTVIIFLVNSACLFYTDEKRLALISLMFAIANGLIFFGE